MERKEFEEKMMEKLKEIVNIYKQYNPKGDYLGMCYTEFGMMINNEYYAKDQETPINIFLGVDEYE